MNRLAGKRAVITGAGSGIGRASTELFAREGARIVAVDVDAQGLAETVAAIQAQGGSAIGVAADAGREEDVRRFVGRSREELGGIDILFANAGVSGPLAPLEQQTVAVFMDVLRVNLLGPFLAIREVAADMRTQGRGSIICTASVAGVRANAGPIPYSASKAGVISLVQTVANEFYGTGIRINAICPGLIETGMTRPLFAAARARGSEAKIGQLNPLTRYGRPEEVAAVALFLASDESSYLNGQALSVDGGLTSTLPFAPSRKGY